MSSRTPIYGADHQRRRDEWRPKVNAGRVKCWRCGDRINPAEDALELGCEPDETWDLGHDDADAAIYRGPEHARRTSTHPACNRATRERVLAKARRPKGKHPGLL